MPWDRIATWLTQTTGLDPAALGPEAVAHAVRRRMAQLGLGDERQYAERLVAGGEECDALVDEVVVCETWFFRDWAPFELLQRHVRAQWRSGPPRGLLRVLSVPCASGEEACSIAIAVLEAGMPAERFQIDAVDISRTAIARCREATYRASSFRGGHLELRERYFTPVEGGHRPRAEVTANIRFRQGNLLEPGFTAGHAPYDIIFCRNLLIYFDAAARKLAADNLYRLLADDGILFAGHTETARTLADRFAPLSEPGAFAYRKVTAAVQGGKLFQSTCPLTPGPSPARGEGSNASASETRRPAASSVVRPAAPSKPVDKTPSLLEQARQLSDAGALDAAAAICRQLVEQQDPCAGAFCLLGLIEEALGDRLQAEGCYNRALFLDPDHYESLVHLILLVESRGDAGRGAALRARAERLRTVENPHAS
jgi:chemotaxis protein methyltransferase WspC